MRFFSCVLNIFFFFCTVYSFSYFLFFYVLSWLIDLMRKIIDKGEFFQEINSITKS